MRAVLQAISEELLRLKAEGETTVPVTEETLAGLRALVKARARVAGAEGLREAVEPVPVKTAEPVRKAGPTILPAILPAKALAVAPARVEALPPPPVVTLPAGDKATRWAALKEQVMTNPVCVAKVRPGRKAVLGAGSLDAKILFVGEAPGEEEEAAGEPFVGPAGQLLTKMIAAMGLKREAVYVGNILCWRPQAPTAEAAGEGVSRAPTAEEMGFCLPYLRASIEIVKPELIVALGGTAAQGLLGEKFTTLAEVRSRWHDFGGTPMMVTYHPNYLLRSNSNRSKRAVWEDLLQVMGRAGLPISDKQRGFFL